MSELRVCGRSGCGREAVYEASVPSYQQTACSEHLAWACWLMDDWPVQVRALPSAAAGDQPERTE